MAEDGFAELHKLKQRLEALGVKIKKGNAEGFESVGAQAATNNMSEENEHLSRSQDDVGRLLERCTRIEATLNRSSLDQGTLGSGLGALSASEDQVSPEIGEHSKRLVVHSSKVGGGRGSPTQKKSKRTKPAFVSTVRQSTTKGHGSTPLSALLADYKDADMRWNHEKAALRRELTNEKKRANKLESNFTKLNGMYESRLVDVRALRTALQNRDQQVRSAVTRTKEMEETLTQANETAAEEMAAIARERDDLKALLVATLKRLETVDRVIQRADVSNAVLEERVGQLEEERGEAISAARAAQDRVQSLLKSQRRVEWQNKLLDRISAVQMSHNRQKTAAIHDLLECPDGQESTMGDGTTIHGDDDVATVTMDDYTETMASELDASSIGMYAAHHKSRKSH